MAVQIMTPQEIISAIQAGTPYYAPRCGGKRMTLSIVNQLGHLIKLEKEYAKLKAELDRYKDNPFECVRDYCDQQQECQGCPRFDECQSILYSEDSENAGNT